MRRGLVEIEASAWSAGKVAEAKPGELGAKRAERMFAISQQAGQAVQRLDDQLPHASRLERERILVKADALLNEMRNHVFR